MGLGVGGGLISGTFFTVLNVILLAVLLFKFVMLIDAAIRPERAYVAAEKMTKIGWLIILGVAVAADILIGGLMSILTIAGLVAAIVYTVDVRPALRAVTGKGGGAQSRRGSSSDGPYGPYNGWR
jgi:hypothetical protein